VVEAVLLGEKGDELRVACRGRAVEETDIAARAQGFAALATQDDSALSACGRFSVSQPMPPRTSAITLG
jgi:methylaspartate ammonia-lyase